MSNTKKRILKMLTIVLIIFAGVGYAIHWAFFDIQRIKGQEYLSESTSPSGTYTVTAYLNNGGATTSYAVLGTVKNNNNGKTKNIYWEYRCVSAEMEWLDDETIIINGIELDVIEDIYDYRRYIEKEKSNKKN